MKTKERQEAAAAKAKAKNRELLVDYFLRACAYTFVSGLSF